MKIVTKIKVKNDLGLHIRPATAIVKLLQPFKSSVTVQHKNETANARSILSILMLSIKKNSLITLTVEGEDAQNVIEKLIEMFEQNFGEIHGRN